MATIQKRVLKNGDVSYRAQVRVKGRPSETATFKRLTDARDWAQQTEADIKRGKYFNTAEAKKRTLTEAIDRYCSEVLVHRKNPVNQMTYLRWWKQRIGVYTLADITSALIVEQRNVLVGSENRFKRSIGTATANRYIQSLGHLFTVARKEWGWVSENPVSNITKYKESRGRVRFLSDEERKKLLQACENSENKYLFTIVILALSTGARKNEILSLQWNDVDLNRGQIILHETKNGDRRVIPLQGYALELMRRQASVKVLYCDYVFPSKKVTKGLDGKFVYQPIDIRTAWENVIKNAHITDFRFHDLRHSAASYLAMNGASLTEIAEVLGHKTLQMVKRYAHLSEAHTSSVVASMNERIFSDGNR